VILFAYENWANVDISCFIEKKGMTLNHDFGFSFPLFSSLLNKEGKRKGE
jgi:hypothetical protein